MYFKATYAVLKNGYQTLRKHTFIYRNKCFVEAGWVVICFAEEQASSQPDRCCRFIANVIAYNRNLLM